MSQQLQSMILATTKGRPVPTAQYLDAEICLLMHTQPVITLPLTIVVRDYVREILDARFHMRTTTEIQNKFVDDMVQFGGLDGRGKDFVAPYILSARGAPQDWVVKGSKRTLLQMTAEKYVYARVHAALELLRDEPFDAISKQKFESSFHDEMQRIRLRSGWQTIPSNPETPYVAITIVVEIILPGHMIAHRFVIFVDYDGVVTLDVNRDGYSGAFTNNQEWLPQY